MKTGAIEMRKAGGKASALDSGRSNKEGCVPHFTHPAIFTSGL
jgi:hypothetical protein